MRHMILVLVFCIGLTICAADLQLKRVWPEKIYYHPGEQVKMEVEVTNPEATSD